MAADAISSFDAIRCPSNISNGELFNNEIGNVARECIFEIVLIVDDYQPYGRARATYSNNVIVLCT